MGNGMEFDIFFSISQTPDSSGYKPSEREMFSNFLDQAEKADEPWSPPKLNPNTPSPIFGGSTGGLLRKAQVSTGIFFS